MKAVGNKKEVDKEREREEVEKGKKRKSLFALLRGRVYLLCYSSAFHVLGILRLGGGGGGGGGMQVLPAEAWALCKN